MRNFHSSAINRRTMIALITWSTWITHFNPKLSGSDFCDVEAKTSQHWYTLSYPARYIIIITYRGVLQLENGQDSFSLHTFTKSESHQLCNSHDRAINTIWTNDLGAKWPNWKTNFAGIFLRSNCRKGQKILTTFLLKSPHAIPFKVKKIPILMYPFDGNMLSAHELGLYQVHPSTKWKTKNKNQSETHQGWSCVVVSGTLARVKLWAIRCSPLEGIRFRITSLHNDIELSLTYVLPSYSFGRHLNIPTQWRSHNC